MTSIGETVFISMIGRPHRRNQFKSFSLADDQFHEAIVMDEQATIEALGRRFNGSPGFLLRPP